jgi:hypothetical protein
MSNKKIFILLPDGVGLRHFAYNNFFTIGKKKGLSITYWNNTPFDLASLGYQEIKIKSAKASPLADIYKNARKHIELNLNIKKRRDTVYDTYRFPFTYKTIKSSIKSSASKLLIAFYSSNKGLVHIRESIKKKERTTVYYNECSQTLKNERPAMVFCTNQRPVLAIAPLLAAQDLGIPTATFIFSWDNLPKATMVVETDYYFVWSDYMKKELINYYPYIQDNQIFVTGTPQFEPHFNLDKIVSKEDFFGIHQLDFNKNYICYSGDDITTCPDDPQYLSDVATAVRQLNREGHSLGIIFRRCPVDFSNRFDQVLQNNKDVITPIAPKWKKTGEGWNAILPSQADLDLQINTVYHTEMVINLGSSMVFDYVAHKKPCAFINYDVTKKVVEDWSVSKIYNYVHFRSIPNKKSVIWLNSKDEIASKIENALRDSQIIINHAEDWFKVINQHPPEEASQRILTAIKDIVQ